MWINKLFYDVGTVRKHSGRLTLVNSWLSHMSKHDICTSFKLVVWGPNLSFTLISSHQGLRFACKANIDLFLSKHV